MDLAGHDLGKYRVLSRIGAGGMGVVYKAHHPGLGTDVAIKVISHDLAANASAVARFRQETMLLARLQCSGIVPVLDADVQEGLHFYVMPLVFDATLERDVEEAEARGVLYPIDRTLSVVSSLLTTLATIHDAGIVHRDIKPANIFVDAEGKARLTDFGLARAPDSAQITTSGATIGSPFWMAPEQLQGRPATSRSDLYQTGLVLYRMLAGGMPYPNDLASSVTMRCSSARLPPPTRPGAPLPEPLVELVSSLTALAPERRPADARAALRNLEALQPGSTSPTLEPPVNRIVPRAVAKPSRAVARPVAELVPNEHIPRPARPVPERADGGKRSRHPVWAATTVAGVVLGLGALARVIGPPPRVSTRAAASSVSAASASPANPPALARGSEATAPGGLAGRPGPANLKLEAPRTAVSDNARPSVVGPGARAAGVSPSPAPQAAAAFRRAWPGFGTSSRDTLIERALAIGAGDADAGVKLGGVMQELMRGVSAQLVRSIVDDPVVGSALRRWLGDVQGGRTPPADEMPALRLELAELSAGAERGLRTLQAAVRDPARYPEGVPPGVTQLLVYLSLVDPEFYDKVASAQFPGLRKSARFPGMMRQLQNWGRRKGEDPLARRLANLGLDIEEYFKQGRGASPRPPAAPASATR